jgi:hypothetical protein
MVNRVRAVQAKLKKKEAVAFEITMRFLSSELWSAAEVN